MVRLSQIVSVGPIVRLTEDHQHIFSSGCARHRTGSFVVWSCPPSDSADETVWLARMAGDVPQRTRVATGADGSLLALPEEVLVSWVVPDHTVPGSKWKISVNKYDPELRLKGSAIPAESVEDLLDAAVLLEAFGEPCLAFVTNRAKPEAHVVFLNSGRRISTPIQPKGCVASVMFVGSGDALFLILDEDDSLEILSLRLESPPKTALAMKWLADGRLQRFDCSVSGGVAMLAFDFPAGWCLQTMPVDLKTFAQRSLVPLAIAGKFPALVSIDDGWLLAWAGGPVLPLQYQGTYNVEINEKQIAEMYTSVRGQPPVDGPALWGPLWLGLLDAEGKCIDVLGELGDRTAENFGIRLCRFGNDGLLTWRAGTDHEDCCLMARHLNFHSPAPN